MPLNKDVGNWIKDFMKSNAPQFKGKSKEERKDMALAAYREKYGSLEENKQGATAAEEDKFHKELDKLVHKTFGHSSDEKKEMKEEADVEQADVQKADIYAYQFMQYFDKIRGVVRHNFGDATRKEFERVVKERFSNHMINEAKDTKYVVTRSGGSIGDKDSKETFNTREEAEKRAKELNKNLDQHEKKYLKIKYKAIALKDEVNEAAKPDFLDVDKDGDKEETMKKALKDKATAKAMKKIKEVVVTDDAEKAEDIANKTGEEVKVVKKGTINEGQHFDYEGKMAQSQLLSIVKNARDLFNMMGEKTQLKSWVQSKLTKAEDYLDAVRTYLEGEALSSTVPAMFEDNRVSDEEGVALSIGDVVKGGDGRIYQIVYSASEGRPSLVPFDLKRRKITTLRDKIYFDDQESSIPRKLNKVMDFSATKGGFMN